MASGHDSENALYTCHYIAKKIGQQRQRERPKTIGFNEQNNALHVRYKFRLHFFVVLGCSKSLLFIIQHTATLS